MQGWRKPVHKISNSNTPFMAALQSDHQLPRSDLLITLHPYFYNKRDGFKIISILVFREI